MEEISIGAFLSGIVLYIAMSIANRWSSKPDPLVDLPFAIIIIMFGIAALIFKS